MLNPCTDIVSKTREVRLEPNCGPLSLRANFGWTLAGNVVYAACQWGILVALAKLGTLQMVGEFALSLRSVQATDALREYEFRYYFSLRLLTSATAVLAVGGVVLFSPYGGHTA